MSVSWFLLVIGTSVLPSAVIVYSRRMLVNGDWMAPDGKVVVEADTRKWR